MTGNWVDSFFGMDSMRSEHSFKRRKVHLRYKSLYSLGLRHNTRRALEPSEM